MVIVPTRELCLQICDVLTLILRRYVWLVGALTARSCPWTAPHAAMVS